MEPGARRVGERACPPAIRNCYYGRAHKLFMQFSERWWETKYDISHGLTVTDLAIRNVVYPPAGQDPRFQKGVIIASYCWEQDSIPYTPLAKDECIAQALEDLVKIHPEARETFEFGVYRTGPSTGSPAGSALCSGPTR